MKGKEATWKEVFGARDKVAIERCMKAQKEKKRKVKNYIYQSKKKVME